MHCIVAFAAPAGDATRAALAGVDPAMQWPRLSALLVRLSEVDRDEAEPTTFSPPHERVLARTHDWQGGDGRWPLAAEAARADGIDPGGAAWGLVSPVHWHVGTDQVSLADPATLALDEAASRAFFEAVQPLFAGDGARLVYGHATRWYVAHDSLAGLRTASLDRVVGRNVDPWLDAGDEAAGPVSPAAPAASAAPAAPAAPTASRASLRRWRRLQAEVQMLLHEHPLNRAREAAGALPVNSFWLSGCGVAQPAPPPLPVRIDTTLRAAALADDAPAWIEAWRRVEEGTLLGLEVALRRGAEVWLTLAGERAAVTFAPQRLSALARLKKVLAKPSVPALLATL